jgi:hypothetical protein
MKKKEIHRFINEGMGKETYIMGGGEKGEMRRET